MSLSMGSPPSDALCVQESCSPAGDALEPRCSAFEPAVGSQEKLDFNRNLKEGKKGFWDLSIFGKIWDWKSHGAELRAVLTWLSSPHSALLTAVPADGDSDANH